LPTTDASIAPPNRRFEQRCFRVRAPPNDHAMKARAHSLLDALIFSSLWGAAAVSALVAASSRAMGVEIAPDAVGLAFSGTLVVYNLDRLRDLDGDRCSSPDP
jgi:hypothetical protein